jgi:hypothetical protein
LLLAFGLLLNPNITMFFPFFRLLWGYFTIFFHLLFTSCNLLLIKKAWKHLTIAERPNNEVEYYTNSISLLFGW